MTDQNNAPTRLEDRLALAALEHVRRILRGNGVKTDSIRVLSHDIAERSLNAATYLELKPVVSERNVPGKIVSGQFVGTQEDANRLIDQQMMKAAGDSAFKAQVADALLRRPDQGFGLGRQAVPLNFLHSEYTWHDSCQSCRGSGNSPCQKCQGRKIETCVKCTGRGLMPCPLCRTTGLLQGVKCTRCLGHRYVPCDGCQRSGMMPCRGCNASGHTKCQTCGGQGWKSHIVTLDAQGIPYFEYDPKTLPKGAADIIETRGVELAKNGDITIKGRIADDRENVLGANYEVNFYYGEIVFAIGKREVKANIFGRKAEITEFPLVLDKILGPAVEGLEEAARDVGSVAKKIRYATRFRLIAQAYLATSRGSVKQAAAFLLKNYDIGLSEAMAEKIALLADSTTAHITRKPRYRGLATGLVISAIAMAAYYIFPARSILAAMLPDIRFDFVLELIPIIAGCIVTTASIKMAAADAIKKALGHLMKAGQKAPPPAKTGTLRWVGYGGILLIALLLIESTMHTPAQTPHWYEQLRFIAAPAQSQ